MCLKLSELLLLLADNFSTGVQDAHSESAAEIPPLDWIKLSSLRSRCSYLHHRGRPQKFFQGRQHRHFAHMFQIADDAMQMYINKSLYPLYAPKVNAHVHGCRKGDGRNKAPLDVEIWHFPTTSLAEKVDILVSSGKNEISPLLAPSGKIFLANPGKFPQLASPGKNPSDIHIAAKGTIMRFVGSNSQV